MRKERKDRGTRRRRGVEKKDKVLAAISGTGKKQQGNRSPGKTHVAVMLHWKRRYTEKWEANGPRPRPKPGGTGTPNPKRRMREKWVQKVVRAGRGVRCENEKKLTEGMCNGKGFWSKKKKKEGSGQTVRRTKVPGEQLNRKNGPATSKFGLDPERGDKKRKRGPLKTVVRKHFSEKGNEDHGSRVAKPTTKTAVIPSSRGGGGRGFWEGTPRKKGVGRKKKGGEGERAHPKTTRTKVFGGKKHCQEGGVQC